MLELAKTKSTPFAKAVLANAEEPGLNADDTARTSARPSTTGGVRQGRNTV